MDSPKPPQTFPDYFGVFYELGERICKLQPEKGALNPMRYVRGDAIRLRAFGGKQIVRRFVGSVGSSVLICTHEEYELAIREGREPLCIGFSPGDVIEPGVPRSRTLPSLKDSGSTKRHRKQYQKNLRRAMNKAN